MDRVLGPGRPPRLEDQRSLPYTSAVLHEVQRSITLLPHVPRCMAADTQLGGYLLPKVGPPPGPDGMGRAPLPLSALGQAGPSWVSRGTPPGGGGAGPSPPAAPPTGHTRDPSAELGAPGQDAVGDPSPVQPGSLPGRRRALCEAGSLPALLCRYPQLAGRGGTGSLTPKEPAHQGPRKLRPPGLPLPTASSTPSLPLGAGPHLALGSPPLQGTGQPPWHSPAKGRLVALCLGFPRRPPRLRGGEPGQVGAVSAVRRPPPQVPPAAPTGPQPWRPGHHARPGLHHAAASTGPLRGAQTRGLCPSRPGEGLSHSPRSQLGVRCG